MGRCLLIIPVTEAGLQDVIRFSIKPISYSTCRESRSVNVAFKFVLCGAYKAKEARDDERKFFIGWVMDHQ